MKLKKCAAVMAVIMAVLGLTMIGYAVGLWDFGFEISSLVGLAAVIPAVVWIFFKGINYVNSSIYFAGIGYIMFKNLFDGFSGRFVVLCLLLVLLAIALPAAASAFKNDEDNNKKEG